MHSNVINNTHHACETTKQSLAEEKQRLLEAGVDDTSANMSSSNMQTSAYRVREQRGRRARQLTQHSGNPDAYVPPEVIYLALVLCRLTKCSQNKWLSMLHTIGHTSLY